MMESVACCLLKMNIDHQNCLQHTMRCEAFTQLAAQSCNRTPDTEVRHRSIKTHESGWDFKYSQ